jgi:hypothetical protein
MIPIFFSSLRYSLASWSTSVLLPAPGAPVKPIVRARPVWGNNSLRSSIHPREWFSTVEMARASARPSPERSWSRRGVGRCLLKTHQCNGETMRNAECESRHEPAVSGLVMWREVRRVQRYAEAEPQQNNLPDKDSPRRIRQSL